MSSWLQYGNLGGEARWARGKGRYGAEAGREDIADYVPQVCVVSKEREFTSGYQEDTLQLVQGSSAYRRSSDQCPSLSTSCKVTRLEAMVTGRQDDLNMVTGKEDDLNMVTGREDDLDISMESGGSAGRDSQGGLNSLSR